MAGSEQLLAINCRGKEVPPVKVVVTSGVSIPTSPESLVKKTALMNRERCVSDPRGHNQRGNVPERKDAHTECLACVVLWGTESVLLGRDCKKRECSCVVDAEAEDPINP